MQPISETVIFVTFLFSFQDYKMCVYNPTHSFKQTEGTLFSAVAEKGQTHFKLRQQMQKGKTHAN